MTDAQPTVHLKIGDVVDGRYELVEEVGEGGFATVYRARQRIIDRPIALKVLHIIPNPKKAKGFAERFAHEARIAAQIQHPNVVTIYDFGFAGPMRQPYIAMELLDGHGLDEEIRQRGRVAPDRAFKLLTAALDALRVGHERGVVHKDLKPANLFLCRPATVDEQLKVLDFGVARLATEATSHTATGEVIGTPQYLAPEYILEQIVSPAFDVYQIGLILVELLGGQKVVPGINPYSCAMRHAEGNLDIPAVLRNGHLGPFLAKALARNPHERFGDAGEMLVALSRVDPQRVAEDLARGYVAAPSAEDDSRPSTAPLSPDEGWVNRVSDRGTPLDSERILEPDGEGDHATDVLPTVDDEDRLIEAWRQGLLDDEEDDKRTEVHSSAEVMRRLREAADDAPPPPATPDEPPPWADPRLLSAHREEYAKSPSDEASLRRNLAVAKAVAEGFDKFAEGEVLGSGPFAPATRKSFEAAHAKAAEAVVDREREVHGAIVPEVHAAATRVATGSEIQPSSGRVKRREEAIDIAALASRRARTDEPRTETPSEIREFEQLTTKAMSKADVMEDLARLRRERAAPSAPSSDRRILFFAIGLLVLAILVGTLVAIL